MVLRRDFGNQLQKAYTFTWFELDNILLHIAFEKTFVKPPLSFEGGIIMPGPHIAIEIESTKIKCEHFIFR